MPMYWKLKRCDQSDRIRTIDNISALRKSIAAQIPRRTASDTLLLATWNIRDFDSNKFGHGPRLPECFHYIAEVISAFDLVAIQEVNEDMRPFEKVMELLGPSWRYIATDITDGPSGNGERMVFVFDSNKVQFKHIAGEIVLPKKSRIGDEDQFARSPFLVRFQSGWFKFYLCTVHLYYGDVSGPGKARRVEEIDRIAGFLQARAKQDGENYILLGDMNVIGPGDETMEALTKHKFLLPSNLTESENHDMSRWMSNMNRDKHYDQIAFYVRDNELELAPGDRKAGVFNYYESVFGEELAETYYKLTMENDQWEDDSAARQKYYMKEWRTWQMSDHLPLWVNLRIDFTDQYLARIRDGKEPVTNKRVDAIER